jgi:hypothetical protein
MASRYRADCRVSSPFPGSKLSKVLEKLLQLGRYAGNRLGVDTLTGAIAPHRDAPSPVLSTVRGGRIVGFLAKEVALVDALAELGQLLLREIVRRVGGGGTTAGAHDPSISAK